jgi:hypothetical protein
MLEPGRSGPLLGVFSGPGRKPALILASVALVMLIVLYIALA